MPIYWRVPLEWETRPTGVIISYAEDGDKVDHVTDKRCFKDENWVRVAAYCRLAVGKPPSMLKEIRARGWMVACHNDYRWHGTFMTFWLFTHPSGHWVKGEGGTDEEAVAKAMSLMRHRP